MNNRPDWVYLRPSPTVVTTRRTKEGLLIGRQLADGSRQDVGGHKGGVGLASTQLPGVRVTLAEAAMLQSYPTHIERPATMTDLVALDLFAGTGWGVACQRLGIEEHGVEIMPEAVASRSAAGMSTIFEDVWWGLDNLLPLLVRDRYELLIASPPCQTFSVAGNGAGRKALDEVLLAIAERDYLDPPRLKAFGEKHDDRTALVLTPLAYIARDLPRLVVLEQVPTVLPVWEAYADVMRAWGYSVVTGILNAEQYGVPQTRRRAILIGRWDAEAEMPTPTHSRYYSRDPKKLDEGVLPWVSMAEALGWGDRTMRSNYGTGGDASKRGEHTSEEPAPTMTSKADRNQWVQERHRGAGMLERHGERKGRPVTDPALTITGNASGTTPGGFAITERDANTPATTVQGVDRVWPRGHKVNADDIARLGEEEAMSRYGHRNTSTAMRVTIEQAAALQSYPEGFRFEGTKGKQFLQVGNAVPPLLAEAILRTLL